MYTFDLDNRTRNRTLVCTKTQTKLRARDDVQMGQMPVGVCFRRNESSDLFMLGWVCTCMPRVWCVPILLWNPSGTCTPRIHLYVDCAHFKCARATKCISYCRDVKNSSAKRNKFSGLFVYFLPVRRVDGGVSMRRRVGKCNVMIHIHNLYV